MININGTNFSAPDGHFDKMSLQGSVMPNFLKIQNLLQKLRAYKPKRTKRVAKAGQGIRVLHGCDVSLIFFNFLSKISFSQDNIQTRMVSSS